MIQNSNKSRIGFFFYSPKDKKVLIHKRDDRTSASPNKWDYFGGSIDPIDQGKAEEAVVREIHEELGIRVDKDGLELLSEKDNMYYVIFPKYIRELVLGEGAGLAWFSFDEAFSLYDKKETKNLITPEAVEYLKKLKKKVE
ncbi:NUDIX domain-containing protein [Patescibacteria group bacterium]|nr:NUDIX domain-containing protein [Patescibacteria group bacterium]